MSADRCTTHHHACDCREAAHQAELDAAQARIAELSTQLVKAEHDWSAEMAEKEQAIIESDNYRTSAEKVAYVHVGLVMERDAALAQVQALSDALEAIDKELDPGDGTRGSAARQIAYLALAQSTPAAAERRGREMAIIDHADTICKTANAIGTRNMSGNDFLPMLHHMGTLLRALAALDGEARPEEGQP